MNSEPLADPTDEFDPSTWPRFHVDWQSNNVRAILAGQTVVLTEDATEADLLWLRKNYRAWFSQLRPHQALNHIPEESVMTCKSDLAGALHAHPQAGPTALAHPDFYPLTYRLDDPTERQAFAAQLPAHDSIDNLWILKPSTLSRGIGIRIEWQLDWLRQLLRDGQPVEFWHEGKPEPLIIQRYIPNLLLLNGHKSELRLYWLIASLDPLRVLMYREGTVRLTSRAFKLDNFDDPLVHITNVYQQIKHGGVQPDTELKWDFPRLQAYLCREKGVAADHLDTILMPRLAKILEYVVRACESRLRRTPPVGHFFGLYGADVILDDQLTPWLTEIQKGPGLSYSDAIKQRVLPPMLLSALSVVLDIQHRRRAGHGLDDLELPDDYCWVIGP